MLDWIQSLRDVQDKDLRIARLQAQIDSVPVEKKTVQTAIEEAARRVDAAKHAVQDKEKAIKSLELEVDTIKAKERDFASKSAMIKDNAEYKAAMHQIDRCRQKVQELEDQQLALMEKAEAARYELKAERSALATDEKRAAQAIADLDIRHRNCTAQIEKLRGERQESMAKVPKSTASRYDRLLKSRLKANLEPVAFAAVQDYTCGFCHMSVPPQVRMDAIKEQAVICPNCSVLLYVGGGEGDGTSES